MNFNRFSGLGSEILLGVVYFFRVAMPVFEPMGINEVKSGNIAVKSA